MSEPSRPGAERQWRYLAPNPKSAYKQLFLKGRRIRAEIIHRLTLGREPMTPEEIAADYSLPLEVVKEAIAYCETNPPEIEEDHRREERRMKATGMSDPGYKGTPRLLTAEEIARLRKS